MPTTVVGLQCLPRVVAGVGGVGDAGLGTGAGLVARASAEKVVASGYWAATGEVLGTP